MASEQLSNTEILSTFPTERRITKEQFKQKVEEFFDWTAQHNRMESSWFLSLKDWAEMNFNRAFEKDYHWKWR